MIKGYRELTENEVKAINDIKGLGEVLGSVISQMESDEIIDKRWLAIAKTDLQKGFMALTRSIAKPTTF